jgi:putative transposase
VTFYHRRLPHWQPSERPLFLTWHLAGSLPRYRFPPPGHASAGQAFVWMDRFLDEARTGPNWLRQPAIAQVCLEGILHCAEVLGHYGLHAFAIMPNHVHLLVTPKTPASAFLKTLKGFTAREANRILHRPGQPFWQSESYDHWVRAAPQFEKIIGYIESNPVRAGLVAKPEDYLWASAFAQRR